LSGAIFWDCGRIGDQGYSPHRRRDTKPDNDPTYARAVTDLTAWILLAVLALTGVGFVAASCWPDD
jgi:hypothetical protein